MPGTLLPDPRRGNSPALASRLPPRFEPSPSMSSPRAHTLLLAIGTYLGFAACRSQAAYEHDHWTGYSVGPSLSRNILGYSAEQDGDYKDFAWRRKKNIELTLRRHFFNN